MERYSAQRFRQKGSFEVASDLGSCQRTTVSAPHGPIQRVTRVSSRPVSRLWFRLKPRRGYRSSSLRRRSVNSSALGGGGVTIRRRRMPRIAVNLTARPLPSTAICHADNCSPIVYFPPRSDRVNGVWDFKESLVLDSLLSSSDLPCFYTFVPSFDFRLWADYDKPIHNRLDDFELKGCSCPSECFLFLYSARRGPGTYA